MEVLFCFDQRYEQHFGAAVMSLILHNRQMLKTIHVITESASTQLRDNLEKLSQTYTIQTLIHEVNATHLSQLKLSGHFTSAIYHRLLAAEVLPQSTQKVLYLDADLIVRGSIADLYNLDLSDCLLAACGQRTVTTKKRLGMTADYYFNSGVLLINIASWRQEDIGRKAIQFAQDFPDKIKMPDQDALNKIVDGNFFNLDRKWNSLVDLYAGTSQVTPESVIIHFIGSLKPWQSWCIHPDKEIYWDSLKRSPWAKAMPTLPKNARQTLSAVRSLGHQVQGRFL
jgi:lipopolysaccharide biosynthesis glycosyltransferase